VYGTILNPNGSAGVRLTVNVSDRDLRREEQLASTATGPNGIYKVEYVPKQMRRAEKSSADLVVRIYNGQELLFEPSFDEIVFNAAGLTIWSINLLKGETTVIDEYTNIVRTVTPLLEG
jgi:hypothetical protein